MMASGATTAIRSAETLAALRALAAGERSLSVRCSDRYARHFLARGTRTLFDLAPRAVLKSVIEHAAPGSYCFAIARTRHFDQALLAAIDAGAQQLVLLGAGYDSRAFRFESELARVRVFEVDHPGTQARKTQILADRIGRLPENLELISCDFNRQSLSDELARRGFKPELRTIFLWEGVSYYLPQAAIDAVLTFVAKCAPGSGVVFDYALSSFVAGDTSTYGGSQVARWLKNIGEPFLFGLDAGEATSFLARHGLHVVSDLGPADLERRYLATTRDGSLGRTLGHVRIAHAQTAESGAPSQQGERP